MSILKGNILNVAICVIFCVIFDKQKNRNENLIMLLNLIIKTVFLKYVNDNMTMKDKKKLSKKNCIINIYRNLFMY